jgi:hypothetical protein
MFAWRDFTHEPVSKLTSLSLNLSPWVAGARSHPDLRAPTFWPTANPPVFWWTIGSKVLSAAAASIPGSDAWCRSLMISELRQGFAERLREQRIITAPKLPVPRV